MTVTIPQLIDLVKAKYTDNPAVLAVADSLVTAQGAARAYSHAMFKEDNLAAYERASIAETHERAEGYSPLHHLHSNLFETQCRRVNALLEVGTLTRTLVVVLQRLGEDVEF